MDTTFGENSLPLDKAVADLAGKFLLGGVINLNDAHRVHVAILVDMYIQILYRHSPDYNHRDDMLESILRRYITMTTPSSRRPKVTKELWMLRKAKMDL